MEKIWFIFEIFINIINSVLCSEFIVKYFKFNNKFYTKKLLFCSLATFLFSVITLNNFYFYSKGMDGFICGVITFIFATVFLNGNIYEKILIVIIEYGTLASINFFVILTGSMIFSHDTNSIISMESNLVRFILILTALFLYFGLTRLLLLFKKKNDEIKIKQWALLISVVALSFLLITFKMETTLSNVNHTFQTLYTVCSIILIFTLNFIIFIFTSYINNNNKITLENTLLKQIKFYEEQNAVNIQKIYGETKAIRHNMKQHVQYLLGGMISIQQSENAYSQKQINDMIFYLNKLNAELVKISPVIDTGNNAINNILNYKIYVANELGIKIEPDIPYIVTGIDDIDIIILLGNLLDNAIEECEKLANTSKKIIIKIVKGRFYLNIAVKNPIHCPVLEKNPNLSSTKEEKEFHGMGVKSIKNIVEKYEGLMNYYERNNYIIAEIKLVESTNTA